MSEKIEIFDISYDGAGVGKVGEKICFVPKTLPGEVVQAKIVSDGKTFCVGECDKILKASPARIEAKCPYFSICGGCDFQHCTYEQEQIYKKQILEKELKKVGFCGEIDFVAAEQRFFYRNKIKFEVEKGKLGYFKHKSHDFFEVKTCPICDEKLLSALPFVEEFLAENKFKSLINVYLRNVGGEIFVCFLFDKNTKIDMKKIKKTTIFERFLTFFAFGEILESDKTKVVTVSSHVAENDVTCPETPQSPEEIRQIDIRAFSQVNDEIAQKLYAEVLRNVAGKNVVNAYSGQGLLTRQIAERARFVFGIELQKSAHEKAEETCAKCLNVKNICGRVENELQKIAEKIDLIVLDPARAGCQKTVLKETIARKTPEIAYISCNFATLVRDLKVLSDFYEIEKVKIFDMFPCTANMETYVVLKRKI